MEFGRISDISVLLSSINPFSQSWFRLTKRASTSASYGARPGVSRGKPNTFLETRVNLLIFTPSRIFFPPLDFALERSAQGRCILDDFPSVKKG